MKAAEYFGKKIEEQGGISDFAALAQSAEGTRLRHRQALRIVKDGDVLLDVGCGTGLFLQMLAMEGRMISVYAGVDILKSAVDVARARASEMGVQSEFRVLEDETKLSAYVWQSPPSDSVVCLGVMGVGQWRDRHAISDMARMLKKNAKRGCFNVPIAGEQFKPEEGFVRFTIALVGEMALQHGLTMVPFRSHEVMLFWGLE